MVLFEVLNKINLFGCWAENSVQTDTDWYNYPEEKLSLNGSNCSCDMQQYGCINDHKNRCFEKLDVSYGEEAKNNQTFSPK